MWCEGTFSPKWHVYKKKFWHTTKCSSLKGHRTIRFVLLLSRLTKHLWKLPCRVIFFPSQQCLALWHADDLNSGSTKQSPCTHCCQHQFLPFKFFAPFYKPAPQTDGMQTKDQIVENNKYGISTKINWRTLTCLTCQFLFQAISYINCTFQVNWKLWNIFLHFSLS